MIGMTASSLAMLAVARGELGAVLADLVQQVLSVHGDLRGARAVRRVKLRLRVASLAQRCAQPCDVQLGAGEVALDMLPFRHGYRRVELDEDIAGFDALAVADVDSAHNSRLERLDDLGPPGGNDLARRRGDDVDFAQARPGKGDAEEGDDR